jgi:hypothetical protein
MVGQLLMPIDTHRADVPMTTNKSLEVLRQILRDLSSPLHSDYNLDLAYIPDAADRLPLPYMVFLTILLGTECKYVPRPGEKTAWSITLRFKGQPFRLEHGKFGMRVAAVNAECDSLTDDLIRTINRAFPVADRVLQPQIDAQVRAGNVTIRNQHYMLHRRYEFFREKASVAYKQPRPSLGDAVAESLAGGKPRSVDILKNDREGFFYGSAAIDAFFSWLEHVLVLLLPFVGYDPAVDDLPEFISRPWKGKLKRVWNLPADKDAMALYDSLSAIKERFRNSVAHGGFEKGDSSLLIHLPGVGAVPATLSRFRRSAHYGWFPLKEASLSDVCALFDRVEAYLNDGPTHYGLRFAESGLDVAFDPESRQEYRDAALGEDLFEDFIEHLAGLSDMMTNMDW